MKKNSKVIRKDYSILDYDEIGYYGLIKKKNRIKIDTRRYKKFFELPDSKIEKRNTVYYLPTKKHREEYYCNQYRDYIQSLTNLWNDEYKDIIKQIKTPEEYAQNALASSLSDGVLEYDEAQMVSMHAKWNRSVAYNSILKSIYANYFGEIMARINGLTLKILKEKGYNEAKFTVKELKKFINKYQKEQTLKSIKLKKFTNFKLFDKYRVVWNLLKHNTKELYDEIKSNYPEMLLPNQEYNDGDYSLYFLAIDEQFLLDCLNNLKLFYLEMCNRLFNENIEDSKWDYDDYFLETVCDEIENITNPLGLPAFL